MAIVQTTAKYFLHPRFRFCCVPAAYLKALLAQRALLTLQVRALFKLTF